MHSSVIDAPPRDHEVHLSLLVTVPRVHELQISCVGSHGQNFGREARFYVLVRIPTTLAQARFRRAGGELDWPLGAKHTSIADFRSDVGFGSYFLQFPERCEEMEFNVSFLCKVYP